MAFRFHRAFVLRCDLWPVGLTKWKAKHPWYYPKRFRRCDCWFGSEPVAGSTAGSCSMPRDCCMPARLRFNLNEMYLRSSIISCAVKYLEETYHVGDFFFCRWSFQTSKRLSSVMLTSRAVSKVFLLSARVTSAAVSELSYNILLIKKIDSDLFSSCAIFHKVSNKLLVFFMTDNDRASCFVRPLTRYLSWNTQMPSEEKKDKHVRNYFFAQLKIVFWNDG